MAVGSKFVLPPDDYYAGVLLRAALHFFHPEIFKVQVVLLLLTTLTAYGVIFATISKFSPERACIYSLGIALLLLSVYWLHFDHSVHASSRYYLRTALVLVIPIFAAMAALSAMAGDGLILHPIARLQHGLISPGHQSLCIFATTFAVVTLIQAFETGKFVTAWTDYRAAVAALATGHEIRRTTWGSSLRFVKSDFSKPLSSVLVLNHALFVRNSREFLAKSTGCRSNRELFLAILRNCDPKRQCRSRSFVKV